MEKIPPPVTDVFTPEMGKSDLEKMYELRQQRKSVFCEAGSSYSKRAAQAQLIKENTYCVLRYGSHAELFHKSIMEKIPPTVEDVFTCEPEKSDLEKMYELRQKRKSVFHEAESSSSKRATQGHILKGNTNCVLKYGSNAGMENHPKYSTTIESLPSVVLEKIFSFLCLDDLINVKFVSETWENITCYTPVWRSAPLVLDHNSDLGKLSSLPYLYTVTGKFLYGDDLFEALINHVKDLRRMDCLIDDNLSPIVVQRFVEKFKNLESIRFSNSWPAVIQGITCPDFDMSLIYYSTCLNLKELQLSNFRTFQHFAYNCKIIEDGFQSLKSLDISCLHCPEENKKQLSYLILKKIHQLTSLVLSYTNVHHDALELIFRNTTLEKLEIVINEIPMAPLDLQGMTGLTSLIVRVECPLPEFRYASGHQLQRITKIILFQTNGFPENLEFLKICFTTSVKPYTGIIRNVIHSVPCLKQLIVIGVEDNIDEQLTGISNLSSLHTVTFSSCLNLSENGIEHITKCAGLRNLKFSGITITNSALDNLRKCVHLSSLEFDSCVLNLSKFA